MDNGSDNGLGPQVCVCFVTAEPALPRQLPLPAPLHLFREGRPPPPAGMRHNRQGRVVDASLELAESGGRGEDGVVVWAAAAAAG